MFNNHGDRDLNHRILRKLVILNTTKQLRKIFIYQIDITLLSICLLILNKLTCDCAQIFLMNPYHTLNFINVFANSIIKHSDNV